MCLPVAQSGWQVLTDPVPTPTAWRLDHVHVIDSRKNDESADTATLFGANTGDAADQPLAARYTFDSRVGAGVDGRADTEPLDPAVA